MHHLDLRRSLLFPRIRDWPVIKTLRYSSKIEQLIINSQVIMSVVWIFDIMIVEFVVIW